MKRIITTINILLLAITMHAQPVLVRSIPQSTSQLTEVGNVLFFTSGDTLWKSNGTAAGTVIVRTGLNNPGNLFQLNGLLYFLNNRTGSYPFEFQWRELWSSNGTTAGTVRLKTSDVGNVQILDSIGNTLFFTVHTSTQGRELWKTNGTVAGTQLVRDINPGTASGVTNTFSEVINGEMFFAANNGVNGLELWKTNGTAAGTVLIEDINPGSANGVIVGFGRTAVANNNLFFVGNDGVRGPELWKSNGTAAGTFLVRDINPSSAPTFFEESGGRFIDYFSPTQLTAVRNSVFFVPIESFRNGQEFVHLWKTNGTAAGTVEVKQVPVENVDQFTHINGKLVFVGMNGVSQGIWASDGTPGGTVMIKGNSVGGDNVFGVFIRVNNTLVFTENVQDSNYHLWKTDGTVAGTTLITKLFDAPHDFTVINNFLFFTSRDSDVFDSGGNARELWQSDLTPDGTFLVRNISDRSFALSSNLEEVNSRLFFTTDAGFRISGPSSPTLWRYTPDPFVVHELTLVNSDTNADIRPIKENDTLYTDQNVTIRAKVSGPVGSVRFFVNGILRRTENVAPYSLAGDIGGGFDEWEKGEGFYTITAIPYSGENGTGTAGDAFTKHIRVIRFVPYFTLVDADTDRDIRGMHDNDTIHSSPSNKITIRANPRVTVGSVYFYLDGAFFWRENATPYSMRGDTGGNYAPWNATFGHHTLMTRAYSGPNGTGTLLETETIHFVVVPGSGPAFRTSDLTMYPNPASGKISLSLSQTNDQIMEVVIVNSSGEIFYQGAYSDAFGSVGIDLSELDMVAGMYFVKIKTSDNQEQVVKLIKN